MINCGKIIKIHYAVFWIENPKVFATASDFEKPDPIQSRIVCYKISKYSDNDFIKFAKFYLLNDLVIETSEMMQKSY